MNRTNMAWTRVAGAAVLLIAAAALAIPDIQIPRQVAGAGGDIRTVDSITLKTTIGQTVAGRFPAGHESYVLRVGFWQPEDGLSAAPQEEIPQKPALFGNAPNPFNPLTAISFAVGREPAHARIRIYDLQGRLVRTLVDEVVQPGIRTATWSGRTESGGAAASGVYFYRLEVAGEVFNRKMLLVK